MVWRETPRAVTPCGGLRVFLAFLQRIGYGRQVSAHLPVQLESPNAIDPAQTYTALLIAVGAGARRFAHTSLLRADRALHVLLGLKRFPTDGTCSSALARGWWGGGTSRWGPGKWRACRSGCRVTVSP